MTVTVDAFHVQYYNHRESWHTSRWLGLPILQCPMDLMVYQELIADLRPRLIIQTGVNQGGSLLFFATVLDAIGGEGQVIGIDINEPAAANLARLKAHPRITFIRGSSVDPIVLSRVAQAAEQAAYHALVSLDSDHSQAHVSAELAAYRYMVKPGNWLVVEDTNINGHPVSPGCYPGPREALAEFLRVGADYVEVDLAQRHLFSFHSWLRRDI